VTPLLQLAEWLDQKHKLIQSSVSEDVNTILSSSNHMSGWHTWTLHSLQCLRPWVKLHLWCCVGSMEVIHWVTEFLGTCHTFRNRRMFWYCCFILTVNAIKHCFTVCHPRPFVNNNPIYVNTVKSMKTMAFPVTTDFSVSPVTNLQRKM